MRLLHKGIDVVIVLAYCTVSTTPLEPVYACYNVLNPSGLHLRGGALAPLANPRPPLNF